MYVLYFDFKIYSSKILFGTLKLYYKNYYIIFNAFKSHINPVKVHPTASMRIPILFKYIYGFY